MIKTNAIKNSDMYPLEPEFFSEVEIASFLYLRDDEPLVDDINSIKVWPEIQEAKIIQTDIGVSNEGQFKTGLKIACMIKVSEKITYSACDKKIPLHTIYNEVYKKVSIVVKDRLKDIDINALMRAGRVQITPYVEGVYARKFSENKIYKYVSIFVEARIC